MGSWTKPESGDLWTVRPIPAACFGVGLRERGTESVEGRAVAGFKIGSGWSDRPIGWGSTGLDHRIDHREHTAYVTDKIAKAGKKKGLFSKLFSRGSD